MIAYVAKDLASGVCLTAHEDVQMPAHSTIKVLLASAARCSCGSRTDAG